MAEGGRKTIENDSGLQNLAYDILCVTLPLCGLPKEMLKSEGREARTYGENYVEFKCCLEVLYIALSLRDDWKAMFESRFKNAGKDMLVTIHDFLKNFLNVSREFKQSNTLYKFNVSVAAYSEMMLFLNSKDVEFDIELMIVSWNNNYNELIAPQKNVCNDYQEVFDLSINPSSIFEAFKLFLKEEAYGCIPYGCRNGVSETFRECFDEIIRKQTEDAMDNTRKHFASQSTTSAASEKPEDSANQSGVHAKDKPGIRYPKPVVPQGSESLVVSPDKIKSPDPPESVFTASGGSEKEEQPSIPSTGLKDVKVRRRRRTVDILIENLSKMNLVRPQVNEPKD